MAEASVLQIEELLYPVTEVRTQGGHDLQGERAGTLLKFGQQIQALDNRPGKYAFVVSIGSDDDNSKNPPYRFLIEVYAVVSIGGAPLEGDAAIQFIQRNGLHIIVGAIRERLAETTARAPWGRFLINAMPLPEAQSILAI